MKFRFCGELDCPDWVLAEINTLSKITSIKIKLLCGQVLNGILEKEIDYDKVNKFTADAKFNVGDVKASLAALSFILTSAAKYDVDGEILSRELQQLGLPKEHSKALCKSYSDKQSKLQDVLRQNSLRLSHLESVDWRVDYVLGSSELKAVNEPGVQIRLKVRNPDTNQIESVVFTLSANKFRVFISDVIQASNIVEGLG